MDWRKPWTTTAWIQQSNRMLNSFHELLGHSLLSDDTNDGVRRAQQLFELDAVVLAHGNQDDPIFCYGNRAALQLWEIDLPTLLTMPSRRSAEPSERSARSHALQEGLKRGYVTDYQGVRISATGRRFLVRNATIWNVSDEAGTRVGQAATFRDWEYLSA